MRYVIKKKKKKLVGTLNDKIIIFKITNSICSTFKHELKFIKMNLFIIIIYHNECDNVRHLNIKMSFTNRNNI